MFFPIGDDQVKGGYLPIFSYAFIALNILAFFYQLSFEDALICRYGSIPSEIIVGEDLHTLFTSMFMHGGWMHLIGNMLFLWVFADNIEAIVGNIAFVAFYIAGGLIASAAHIYIGTYLNADIAILESCCYLCNDIGCAGNLTPCPGSIPSVGASGAISAVMGAYLVMFPSSRVKMISIFGFFKIPAILFLGFWIFNQFISGTAALTPEAAASGGTAWWAHIGGFVFGVIAGYFGRGGLKDHANRQYQRQKRDDGFL